ncbi:MAG TPA: M23 family metallopeptidase [Candidatus Nanoarchaeia archaeon]|nr:M23 family metallopeptidase [Candidatus Nanoarchaeia archaeon]
MQQILKLPFSGKLRCSQSNLSKGSHNIKYPNTKFALDFETAKNKPFYVLASATGKTKVWKPCKHKTGNCMCGLGFGNQIRIYHDRYVTFYAHLSKIFVKTGQNVKQGDRIGIAGKTGLAGTLHLHWTLAKETEGTQERKNFKPFWSIEAKRIEVISRKHDVVSSRYFKKGRYYISTNANKF